ncbi:MAG TPA: sigma-70 family RNA polymerase sigma factor [Planctomycetota bacterium]|nr:sigma-70 family RNA polymerase sigma factor [Planctomycetota bacterium]
MSGVAALVDHLFRHEAGKMVATLVRILGLRNVDVAEDVVQDALLRALEVWKYRGVPENPSAWLFQAARNRAVDLLRRRRLHDLATRKLSHSLSSPVDDHGIRDDQLRMMSSCAHPSLPSEAQVTVILKFLCGFSVPEISQAFLTSEAAIEKRLARAKGTLRRSPGPAPLDASRLDAIHQALYLLFSEGYHGSHPERSVREELCAEALRLGTLLADHPSTATPATFALLGLMCLHAARLPSRIDDAGSLILLEAQDRSRWSRPLIDQGFAFLNHSASGDELTAFHLEAGIAALHARAENFGETDWPGILKLYTHLYRLRPTPIVALNRAIALGRVDGPEPALRELENIRRGGRLQKYPFLEAAAGDLHHLAGRPDEARAHLRRALALARNEPEREVLHSRLRSLA